MRHLRESIKKLQRINTVRGLYGRKTQENNRLQHALEFGPTRPIESYYVFGIATYNPSTGIAHIFEIRHDVGNGTNRYNIYLDGELWKINFSRWWFVNWLFERIESVRVDWET